MKARIGHGLGEVTSEEVAGAQLSKAQLEVVAADVKVEVVKAKVGVAEAKVSVAEAKLEAGEADPVDVAEAKAGVAEAKVGVAGAKVSVAEAKVGVAEATVGVAEAKVSVAEAKLEAGEVDPADVAEAKAGVAEAKASVAEAKVGVAEATVGVAEAKVNMAKAKLETGEADPVDVAEAKVGVAGAKVSVAEAKVSVAKAKLEAGEADPVDVAEAKVGVAEAKIAHGKSRGDSEEDIASLSAYADFLRSNMRKLASLHTGNANGAPASSSRDHIGIVQPKGPASRSMFGGFAETESPVSDPAALLPLVVSGHLELVVWPGNSSSSDDGSLALQDLDLAPALDAKLAPPLFRKAFTMRAEMETVRHSVTHDLWTLVFSSSSRPLVGLDTDAMRTFHLEKAFVAELYASLSAHVPTANAELPLPLDAIRLRCERAAAFCHDHAAALDAAVGSAAAIAEHKARLADAELEASVAAAQAGTAYSERLKNRLLSQAHEWQAQAELLSSRAVKPNSNLSARVREVRSTRSASNDPSTSGARSADDAAGVAERLTKRMWHERPILPNAVADVLFGVRSTEMTLGFGVYEPGVSHKNGQVEAYAHALGLALAGLPLGPSVLSLSGQFPTAANMARGSPTHPSLQLAAHLVRSDHILTVDVASMTCTSLDEYVTVVVGFAVAMSEVTAIMVRRLHEPLRAPRSFGPNVAVVDGYAFKWFLGSTSRMPNAHAWRVASPELCACALVVKTPFDVRRCERTINASLGTTAVLVTHFKTDIEDESSDEHPDASMVTLSHFQDVARRLAALHGIGMVHGDIRRNNMVFDNDGNGFLIDFDLARPIRELYPASLRHVADGKRAPGLVDPGHGRRLPMETVHDVFSLGAVMDLYQAADATHQTTWSRLVDAMMASDSAGKLSGSLPAAWPESFALQRRGVVPSGATTRGTGSPPTPSDAGA